MFTVHSPDVLWMIATLGVCVFAPMAWWLLTRPRTATALGWSIAACGFLTPWVTGACVKLYLDAMHRPTYPWSAFFTPTSVLAELQLSLYMAAPMLAFGWAVPRLLRGPRLLGLTEPPAQRRLVCLTALGGIAAMCWVYLGVFWQFDPMLLLWPWGFYAVPGMAAGAAIGWIAGRRLTVPRAPAPPSSPR